jgi:hypothetical protein
MPVSECSRFAGGLEEWIEGQRSAAFAEHLAGCEACRLVLVEMEAIRATASEMGSEQSEPSQRVWLSLKAQLEAEGIIRAPLWNWRVVSSRFLPRPVLSFAYAAVLVLAGGLMISQVNESQQTAWDKEPEISLSAAAYDKQLTSTENQTMQSWPEPDPEIAAAIKTDLSLADEHISQCQQTVREQPQNELARDYLDDAYQQKAELLASMVERGVNLQ